MTAAGKTGNQGVHESTTIAVIMRILEIQGKWSNTHEGGAPLRMVFPSRVQVFLPASYNRDLDIGDYHQRVIDMTVSDSDAGFLRAETTPVKSVWNRCAACLELETTRGILGFRNPGRSNHDIHTVIMEEG